MRRSSGHPSRTPGMLPPWLVAALLLAPVAGALWTVTRPDRAAAHFREQEDALRLQRRSDPAFDRGSGPTLPRVTRWAAPPCTPPPTATRTITPTPTMTPPGIRIESSVLADTYISVVHPDTNFGDRQVLQLRNSPTSMHWILLAFDPPELPAGTEMVDARLQLHPDRYHCAPDPGAIYLVDEPWAEYRVTWDQAPAMHRIEHVPFLLQSEIVHVPVAGAIRAWSGSGAENHGICLKWDAEDPDWGSWLSRESDSAPSLVVYYQEHTPTPTPSPVPTPTITPAPTPAGPVIDLTTNQELYQAGDRLLVRFDLEYHQSFTQPAVIWVVLEAEGRFYSYPAWDTELEGFLATLIPGESFDLDILDVALPDPLPPGGPYAFWAVVTHRTSGEVLSNLEHEPFWFE